MENFCNTRDWFWKARIKSQFGLDPSDLTIQIILENNGGNWFRVYFFLVRLNKLKQKLSPALNRYNLTELYNLQELDLDRYNLNELPTQIGQLVNLQEFSLNNNKITELPIEIGQLVNLKELWLHNNQLTELPQEIGQ